MSATLMLRLHAVLDITLKKVTSTAGYVLKDGPVPQHRLTTRFRLTALHKEVCMALPQV